jgi:UPF0755 protein
MNTASAGPVALAIGLAALLGVGIWLLLGTPGSLVNEEPPPLGRTVSPQDEIVIVEVLEGESAGAIGRKLEGAGIIQSARLFQVLTSLMGLEDDLEAGDYEFRTGGTALTAVRRISRGQIRTLGIVIREGLRLEETAELLEREGVVSAGEFRQALQEEYSASFLGELPPDGGLEGFLFPATYSFPAQVAAHDVVQRLLGAFDQRYQEEIQPKLAPDGLSLREVVTLASIIEREARVPEDRPLIASVFLNRLERGMKLDADPTVQYAVGNDPASVQAFDTYWKPGLTVADLQTPSPYNTYVNAGLPPGPIANPGLASILAVLEPADTSYLYFVARQDGSHVFAETLEQHNRNVCQVNPECN